MDNTEASIPLRTGVGPGRPPARGRKLLWGTVEAVILIAIIAGSVLVYRSYAQWESTDDAQIDGYIYPVNARIQGFVTRVTNRGTFVTQLSKEDISQILRVRAELEGLAAELLEQRATESDVAALKAIVDEMRTAAANNDLERFYRCDLQFHRTIWSLSGNRHLVKALDLTVVPLFAFFIMKNPSDSVEALLESVEWHSRIVKAIASGHDARRCMEAALRFFNEQENWMLFDHTAEAHEDTGR